MCKKGLDLGRWHLSATPASWLPVDLRQNLETGLVVEFYDGPRASCPWCMCCEWSPPLCRVVPADVGAYEAHIISQWTAEVRGLQGSSRY